VIYMAWKTPKTNWGQPGQTVPGVEDFNRIEGNILELESTKETPAGAQAKVDAHEAKAAPHSGHATATALSTHISDTLAHSATSLATANRIVRRDGSGRAKVAAPSASDDIARKDTVDNAVSSHAAVKATSQTIGHVKPDGSSISVDASGTISAAVKSVAGRTGAVTLSVQDILGLTAVAVELGSGSYAGDVGAVAIGRNAYAHSQYSTAMGDSSYAHSQAIALGKEASARAQYAIAIGDGANVDVDQLEGISIGAQAKANSYGTTVGGYAEAGSFGVAIGNGAKTTGIGGIAVGNGAMVVHKGVAIGNSAVAAGNSSLYPSGIVIGSNASASGATEMIAIGDDAEVWGAAGIAIGTGSWAHGLDPSPYSMALGPDTTVVGFGSVAIGHLAEIYGDHRGVLGTDSMQWSVPGSFSVSGSKNFEIPHPKPEKSATHVIRHGAVEAPSPGETLYRWRIRAEQDNDTVEISLPDYFVHLNTDVQVFVTPQGHFGNGYGDLDRDREQLVIRCQLKGEYNVLVIGTRCDDHLSIRNWHLKGVERRVGETWEGETEAVYVNEIIEIEEIKEVSI
jgi:hypothetical protein